MTTQEEINAAFEEWVQFNVHGDTDEQYDPGKPMNEVPSYTPSTTTTNEKKPGPQRLTIEEYKQRQAIAASQAKWFRAVEEKPKKRGGKRVKARQKVAELHRIIAITNDRKQKKLLIEGIRRTRCNYGHFAEPRRNHKQQQRC